VLQDECLTPFHLSPTQNILPFTQLVLKLVVLVKFAQQGLTSDPGSGRKAHSVWRAAYACIVWFPPRRWVVGGCVRACVRARAHARRCVRAYVRVCVCVCLRACACVCVRALQAYPHQTCLLPLLIYIYIYIYNMLQAYPHQTYLLPLSSKGSRLRQTTV
jgi:hypothetical protein